jgi:photosystem I subunit XI
MTQSKELIQPYNGDPLIGDLSTPVNNSAFTRTFINNLPAYRKNLSPLVRGLEIGLAHGYFVLGPWVNFGPLRGTPSANMAAFISALSLLLVATAGMSIYGLATFQKDDSSSTDPLKTADGWGQLTAGFFMGAMGGLLAAYLLLENFAGIDSIFRGTFH